MSELVAAVATGGAFTALTAWILKRRHKSEDISPKTMPDNESQTSIHDAINKQVLNNISNNINRDNDRRELESTQTFTAAQLRRELEIQAHNATSGNMSITNVDTKNELSATADQAGGK